MSLRAYRPDLIPPDPPEETPAPPKPGSVSTVHAVIGLRIEHLLALNLAGEYADDTLANARARAAPL